MVTRTPPRGWLKDIAAQRAPAPTRQPACHVALRTLFKRNPNKPLSLLKQIEVYGPRRVHKTLSALRRQGWVIRPTNSGIRWCYVYIPELCTAH